jgi:hypothetical protein
MPSAGVKPAIPAGERPQTQALDRAAMQTSHFNKEELIKVLSPIDAQGNCFKRLLKFTLKDCVLARLGKNLCGVLYLFHMHVKLWLHRRLCEQCELEPTDNECCGE